MNERFFNKYADIDGPTDKVTGNLKYSEETATVKRKKNNVKRTGLYLGIGYLRINPNYSSTCWQCRFELSLMLVFLTILEQKRDKEFDSNYFLQSKLRETIRTKWTKGAKGSHK